MQLLKEKLSQATCEYNNTKNDREVLFRLPKYRSFHKDWIHATCYQFDNLPSKIFIW